MKAHHKNRLLILADALDNHKKFIQKFDIRCWGYRGNFCGRGDCGTVACAGGLATLIPELRKAGLINVSNSLTPVFKDRFAFDALEKFFGLTYKLTLEIFDGAYYACYITRNVTPKMVSKKIRKLIKTQP